MRQTAFPPATFDPLSPDVTDFSFDPASLPARNLRIPDDRGLSDGEIAALPTERIVGMSRQELIAVIRGVRADHLRPGVPEGLDQTDGDTLRRLVYLTRRLCRDRQRLAGGATCGSPR